jgi:hypothetical protein
MTEKQYTILEIVKRVSEFAIPHPVRVQVFAGDSQLRSYKDSHLAGIADARHWEFSVDYFATLQGVDDETKEVVLINEAKATLGLTEIGELHVLSRLARAPFSLQIAEKGLSRDLYSLLLRLEVENRLLKYGQSHILIYAGKSLEDQVSDEAFFPPTRFEDFASRFQ